MYGRWRSLTHATLRASVSEEQMLAALDERTQRVNNMAFHICYLFIGFSYTKERFERFSELHGQGIFEIVDATVKLSRRLREEVVTKDYRWMSSLNSTFNPNYMEREFPGKNMPAEDPVVAVLQLGILGVLKPGREKIPSHEVVLKKARVLTLQLLEEFTTLPRNFE